MQTRFHIRRKAFALLVCLVFSTALWLLNDLNRLQSFSVQIPVRFSGLPYDMVTTNSLPTTMDATVEATGFVLLWRHFTSEDKVVEIPLRLEQGMVMPNKTYLFNINYYLTDISNALGSHLKIRRIFPDTFSIRFEKKFVKKVPVVFQSDLQFEKEFHLAGDVKMKPDSVIISGTKEKIFAIDSVHTQMLLLKKLKKDYTGNIKLEYINGISYNIEAVDVTVPVQQFTEKIIELKVSPANVPPNYELNTIPDMVTVKLMVPISDFNSIESSQFQVSAEFPQKETQTGKILLKVTRKPEFVKVIAIDPLSVEYKIKQKIK